MFQHEIFKTLVNEYQTAEIVEKKSKRGKIFYVCQGYPKCDFALWDKPTGEVCPNCGGLMVEKKTGIVCSNCGK